MTAGRQAGFDAPVRIRAHPPLPILAVLAVLHGGAIACVYFASLPFWLKPVLVLLVASSLVAAGRRYLRVAVMELVLNAGDRWQLIDDHGEARDTAPAACLFLHPALAILTVKDGKAGVFPFVLSPFNTDPDGRRRLRVRLRFSKSG
ncbi:MAG: hypothetical protein P8126_07385 [Gammaproteobacteria bacterium]|jgi:hypothetical protein